MADPGNKRRVVLLVDEDPSTARLVQLSLHGPRCQVVVAGRAPDGISLAARHRPDLVLLEVQLRGATGFDLAQKLQRGVGCAVAFLTRDPSIVSHFRAIQLGAMAYMVKPTEGKRLGRVVEAVFQRIEAGGVMGPVTGPGARRILDTLQQLQEDAASGTLRFLGQGETAQITFSMGRVQRASCGTETGEEAISAIARRADWGLEFHEGGKPVGLNVSETAETDPTLPGRSGSDDPDTVTEARPRTRMPMHGFVPESALGTTQDEPEQDERTIVDPTHPLLDGIGPSAIGQAPSAEVVIQPPSPGPAQQLMGRTVTEVPLDLTTTEEFFEEDVPTPLQFSVEDDPSVPTAPAPGEARPRVGGSDAQDALHGWLSQVNRAPLLLVIPNDQARRTLSQAAERAGFTVLCVENGKEAYSSAIHVRPVAVLCDLKVPDMDGRELVGAVRTDFMIRETPFLLVCGDDVASRVASEGVKAVEPIMQGLHTALMPRVQLFSRLQAGVSTELGGPLEPIGVCALLRILGAARLSGRLVLRCGDQRNAEVILGRGEICGATVNVPQSTVGPLAMLHLVGYEWREYSFEPQARADENLVPLGNLSQLLESSCQQNNVLLHRVYKQGVNLDEVTVDKAALDFYLQTLPPEALEVLIRVVEGEPAAVLAAQGIAPANLLRSMVFELRRRSVIRPESLRSVKIESLGESLGPAPALPPELMPKQRRRWLVVMAAGFATVVLVAGGYLIYWHLAS